MKYIRLFENFKYYTHEILAIEKFLKENNIKNYTINEDNTVNVYDSVDLRYLNIEKLPIKFGKVSGHFICASSQLETLEGCPHEVGGIFNCSNNNLNSLKYSPSLVDGDFVCIRNDLTSLEGMPLEIGGDFKCYNNPKLRVLDSISNIEGKIWCDPNIDKSRFEGYCKEIIEF